MKMVNNLPEIDFEKNALSDKGLVNKEEFECRMCGMVLLEGELFCCDKCLDLFEEIHGLK